MTKELYTDGSCLGNPGPGGYAALLVENKKIKSSTAGRCANTTNNAMELKAIDKGLDLTSSPTVIVTDSRYCQMGLTEWIKSWKRRGWKTSTGKPVKNLHLWKSLSTKLHKIASVEKIRGHTGIRFNERADGIAVLKAKQQKQILKHIEDCKRCRHKQGGDYRLISCRQAIRVEDLGNKLCPSYSPRIERAAKGE